jgi:hypothetical protein
MLTVIGLLAIAALILTILSITTPPRAPLWIAVLLLAIAEVIRWAASVLPLGK